MMLPNNHVLSRFRKYITPPAPFDIWSGILGTSIPRRNKFSIRYDHSVSRWRVSVINDQVEEYIGEEIYYAQNMDHLTAEINNKIRRFRRDIGGVIYVTLHKHVIKPITQTNEDGEHVVKYYYLGQYPNFNPVFDDGSKIFDLRDVTSLKCGDEYPYPPVGMKYRYNATLGRIYGYLPTEKSEWEEITRVVGFPDHPELKRLTELLREIRGEKVGNFFVNCFGLVFAKSKHDDYENWYYITKLSKNVEKLFP